MDTTDKRSLLLVDDDPNIHNIVDVMLKDVVDDILHVYNEPQALKRVRNQSIQCVILDLYLQDDLGLKLLRELKKDPEMAIIPVLMISADGTCNRLASAYDSGAFGYIIKPLNQVVLQAKVRSAFREYNLINNLITKCILPG